MSRNFITENFLLHSDSAVKLYHEHAKEQAIIDYHCHLPVEEIANDRIFENISQIWLEGDHYKWRAMRAAGVNERYCTGDASPRDKFRKWAETVPLTLRNPLYHWTHLELKRYFGIDKLLNGKNADKIFDEVNDKLRESSFSVRNLLRKMNVETLCTTDDPIDSLEFHQIIAESQFEINVLPAWRPDKATAIESEEFNNYIDKLGEASKITINNLNDLYAALKSRHDYFHERGCRLSDHGLETFYATTFSEKEIINIFSKARNRANIDEQEIKKFKSALLLFLAELDHERGWVQQFHIGAIRNNNLRMYQKLGPDKGFDSIGDAGIARDMSNFLSKLDSRGKLTKTILYNLNPSDNEVFATMAGNFNDGTIPGKMQFGAAWWFLDQKDGMTKQINSLSNMGLLSQFVGMLTDSRSFMSYPRHEYFRRTLCNIIGEDVTRGEIPEDYNLLGKLVEDICYFNAKRYFGFGK